MTNVHEPVVVIGGKGATLPAALAAAADAEGWPVLDAAELAPLLRRLFRERPELAVVSIAPPLDDCLALLWVLRERRPETRLLAVADESLAGAESLVRASGAHAWLAGPSRSTLLALGSRLCTARTARSAAEPCTTAT